MRNKQANLAVHHTIRACTRTYTIQGRAREENFYAKLNAICKKEISRNSGLHALLTFHPLSLKFLADLDNTQLYTQFAETISRERLRQNVGDLLLSADVLNVHLPISNTLPNEMKSHIYVFTSVVENKILTEGYSRLAIHLQQESCAPLALQLCKQLR